MDLLTNGAGIKLKYDQKMFEFERTQVTAPFLYGINQMNHFFRV